MIGGLDDHFEGAIGAHPLGGLGDPGLWSCFLWCRARLPAQNAGEELPQLLQTGANLLLLLVPVAHCMDEFAQNTASATGALPMNFSASVAATAIGSRRRRQAPVSLEKDCSELQK